MNIKYTKGVLKKLEQFLEEVNYRIRYEKGQFHSGYCVLENKNIAIINKFLDTEGRINALIDILGSIDFDFSALSSESQRFYTRMLKPGIEKGGQIKIDFGQE